MTRPSKDDFWFGLAAQYATRATCPRASIGCILVKLDRIVSAGFNGAADRQEHCPDTPEHLALEHCEQSWHAERNAIRNAFVPLNDATAYVVGPRRVCPDCTDRLRMAGVTDIRWRPSVLTLDSVLAEVNAWQAVTFPRATPASVVEHLRREVLELVNDPTDTAELADVVFLVVGLAYELGLSMADLAAIVAQKLAVNKARTWGEPDEHGVTEHIRDEVAPCG